MNFVLNYIILDFVEKIIERSVNMKLIVALFWSAVIGEVVGYIMTALAGVADNAIWTLVVSIIFGLFVYVASNIVVTNPKEEK